MNKVLIILDKEAQEVHTFNNYDEHYYDNLTDFLEFVNEKYNLELKECNIQWMVADKNYFQITTRTL